MKTLRFLSAVLIAGTLLAGCGSGSGSSVSNSPPAPVVDAPATTRSQYGPLVFTLTVPKTTYSRGEVVPAVLTVTNTSTNKVTVQTNPQAFLHVAQGGKAIYAFDGFGSASILMYVYFAPGEVKTYPLPWGQYEGAPDKPSQVDIGHYQLSVGLRSGTVAEETKQTLSPSALEELSFSPPPIDITVQPVF